MLAAISYQLIKGLAYLHHERTLHRDVKVANVLLDSSGRVKLADLGLASNRNETSMNTTMVGTTRYMAPERLRAKPYGTPSDLWSLGLVLLECATQQVPWDEAHSMVRANAGDLNHFRVPQDLDRSQVPFLCFVLFWLRLISY
jgi:serine/threonine protein kinase